MNNLDFVYRLNLPEVEEILISPNILNSFTTDNFRGSRIFYPEPSEIIKPEWLRFKNYSWDYCSIFFRSGNQNSIIHRDNPLSPNSLHWGINWIVGKNGFMDYWDISQVEKENIIVDSGGGKTVILEINDPPIKSYLTENGAYLINASMPHRIRNESNNLRIALSLRSKKFRSENPHSDWNDILNIFQDIISY